MNEMEKLVIQIRRDIVRMVNAVNSGHPGGSLGCTEFFVTLFFKILKRNKDFSMDGKDEDLSPYSWSKSKNIELIDNTDRPTY